MSDPYAVTYAVTAEFRTSAESHDAFAAICRYDSERSVADEPGCRLFHVLEPADRPDSIVVYEIYDSEDAFKAHQQTPHFRKFAEALEEFQIETLWIRFMHKIAG